MAESILICRHNKNGTGYCECLGEYCVEGPCKAEELIEYAPVRHAKWTTRRTEMHDGEWYCTGCDYEPQVFENSNYCPVCGALMDKEE